MKSAGNEVSDGVLCASLWKGISELWKRLPTNQATGDPYCLALTSAMAQPIATLTVTNSPSTTNGKIAIGFARLYLHYLKSALEYFPSRSPVLVDALCTLLRDLLVLRTATTTMLAHDSKNGAALSTMLGVVEPLVAFIIATSGTLFIEILFQRLDVGGCDHTNPVPSIHLFTRALSATLFAESASPVVTPLSIAAQGEDSLPSRS